MFCLLNELGVAVGALAHLPGPSLASVCAWHLTANDGTVRVNFDLSDSQYKPRRSARVVQLFREDRFD